MNESIQIGSMKYFLITFELNSLVFIHGYLAETVVDRRRAAGAHLGAIFFFGFKAFACLESKIN